MKMKDFGPSRVQICQSANGDGQYLLMLHLYWSESDVAWNGLLLFYAAYIGAKAKSLATFRFRSNIIAPSQW